MTAHRRQFTGWADEFVPYGSEVLVRGRRISLAASPIANGIAVRTPFSVGEGYKPGEMIVVDPFADFRRVNLQALADGPIMDSNHIFLPAGKLSEAEYRERLAAEFEAAGIDGTDL